MTSIIIASIYLIGGVVFYLVARGKSHKEGNWAIQDRAKAIIYSVVWPIILVFLVPFLLIESLEDKSPAKW
jgi:hypothetical protein